MQNMKSSNKVFFSVMCSIICVGISFLNPPANAQEAKEECGLAGIRSPDLFEILCNKTLYFDVCNSSLSSYPAAGEACEWEFGRISVEVSLNEAQGVYDYFVDLNETNGAIEDCVEVLDDMTGELQDCLLVMADRNWTQSSEDVKTWLSAALTYPYTCAEGFADQGLQIPPIVKEKLEYLTKLTSNALAIATYLSDTNIQKISEALRYSL